MLMPVQQTLVKKLNKDDFQGERETEMHSKRCWAHISEAPQARVLARTGFYKPSIK